MLLDDSNPIHVVLDQNGGWWSQWGALAVTSLVSLLVALVALIGVLISANRQNRSARQNAEKQATAAMDREDRRHQHALDHSEAVALRTATHEAVTNLVTASVRLIEAAGAVMWAARFAIRGSGLGIVRLGNTEAEAYNDAVSTFGAARFNASVLGADELSAAAGRLEATLRLAVESTRTIPDLQMIEATRASSLEHARRALDALVPLARKALGLAASEDARELGDTPHN